VILCSACLAGVRCRYDGGSKPLQEIGDLLAEGRLIPVCPEQLGGLPTPRCRMSFRGGGGDAVWRGKAQVVDEEGRDRTEQMKRGAEEALRLARRTGARRAILKEKSPSCGCTLITVDGSLRQGSGVCASLLSREGIVVEGR